MRRLRGAREEGCAQRRGERNWGAIAEEEKEEKQGVQLEGVRVRVLVWRKENRNTIEREIERAKHEQGEKKSEQNDDQGREDWEGRRGPEGGPRRGALETWAFGSPGKVSVFPCTRGGRSTVRGDGAVVRRRAAPLIETETAEARVRSLGQQGRALQLDEGIFGG